MATTSIMEKNTKQTYEDSNEENQINKSSNEYEADFINQPQRIDESSSNYKSKQRAVSHYTSQHNQRERTHSRSRSPNNINSPKKWISSNAFINFVRDLRHKSSGEKNTKLFQIAGEKWRKMSFEEKQPYVNAALSIRNRKNEQKNQELSRSETNAESAKNENTPKQETANKKSAKNKQKSKKGTKNESNTESDDGSITSGTTASVTSEDTSDSN
nr:PREDICTED: high mobility group B protein 3-like isoform X2 [Megachile rotundata]